MSCPYCGNDKGNTFDWNEFGQFLVKCNKCKIVFRPSKTSSVHETKDPCECSVCHQDLSACICNEANMK